jgi:hypothetical protein
MQTVADCGTAFLGENLTELGVVNLALEKLSGRTDAISSLEAEPDIPKLPLTAAAIASHPSLVTILKRQAQMLLDIYIHNQRATSVFATQQRWLLSHLAIALFFETGEIIASRYLDLAERNRISSRNTADAFLKECVKYGLAIAIEKEAGSRTKPYRLPEPIVALVGEWSALHLATLDALDGATRLQHFRNDPAMLARLQPAIVRRLVISEPIRDPDPAFSLFIWLNDGGVVMDWLYAGMDMVPDAQGRILSSVTSISQLQRHITISRSHLALKLREAERLQTLGWSGERGNSRLWLSAEFRDAYHLFQAAKLEIVAAAFAEIA